MVVVVGAGELEEEMRMAEQLRALATFFLLMVTTKFRAWRGFALMY